MSDPAVSPPLISVPGYHCRYENLEHATSTGIHCHNAYELYIHIRGEHAIQLDDAVYPLQPMDMYVTSPGQPHGLVLQQPSAELEYLVVALTQDVLRELSFRDCSLQSALERIISRPNQYVPLTNEIWRNIAPLAAGVKEDAIIRHPAERQISMGCLSAMLGILCFTSELGHTAYVTRRNTRQVVHHVSNYILQNFAEDCSLAHLAEMFNISKYHLARSFTRAYGVSLHQYVLACRITYAKRLLQQGESPSDIAQACGFGDYTSFLRAFTKQAGCSPSQWRRELCPAPHAPEIR